VEESMTFAGGNFILEIEMKLNLCRGVLQGGSPERAKRSGRMSRHRTMICLESIRKLGM
jgi:hypothetical protein